MEIAAPTGYSNAGLSDVNADASVAVGIATDNTSGSAGGFAAMVLTTENGFEPLANYLTRHGVDLSNWELSEGLSVSQDGKTFGGNGYHRLPSGEVRPEAFIAIIEGQLPCACAADFDQSGGTPDANDIDAFFLSWLYGDQSADVDCSGGTPDANDIDVFFQEWLAGGC